MIWIEEGKKFKMSIKMRKSLIHLILIKTILNRIKSDINIIEIIRILYIYNFVILNKTVLYILKYTSTSDQ